MPSLGDEAVMVDLCMSYSAGENNAHMHACTHVHMHTCTCVHMCACARILASRHICRHSNMCNRIGSRRLQVD